MCEKKRERVKWGIREETSDIQPFCLAYNQRSVLILPSGEWQSNTQSMYGWEKNQTKKKKKEGGRKKTMV